ncbi:RNA-binding ribosome biosynthesis protein mak21 [Marasmius crinis-equi]|uniref:RNA-binding ribosome biosynthesis protein mak21 n=1 Tax=Marasmius crinis-equi TaxID=585013 RepID=A0ABR3FQM6_9AGAR
MARIHKEKGGKLQHKSNEKPAAKSSKKNDVLKSQIKSLGGNEADYDLVKDVDENVVAGTSKADPSLTKDLSKFLKSLNFDVPETSASSSKDAPGKRASKKSKKKDRETDSNTTNVKEKEKEIVTEKTKTAKGKKGKKTARENDTVGRDEQAQEEEKAEEPVEETPKVELPKQVSFNSDSTFVVQPTSQWYSAVPPLKPSKKTIPPITSADLHTLTSKAADLHAADVNTFRASSNSSSHTEASFLSKIIQSGTLSDRLSALTLLVQSSPLHNIKALETLKGMAERGKGKGGREESLKALRCIVDWWVGGGAPDRKLKYFRDQQLNHPSVSDQHLTVWFFEDWLKKYFFSVLQILEQLSLDPLPYVRMQTMNLILTLLRDKAEQEQNLLRLLVNKLGDTEKSVCSRASYHILQLLQSHPSMKGVVVREITTLVLRPAAPTAAATVSAAAAAVAAGVAPLPDAIANRKIKFSDDSTPGPSTSTSAKGKAKSTAPDKKPTNVHARYYATITFNQIVLTPGDRDVALKLIDVYFELFRELLGEGKENEEDAEEDVQPGKKGKEREAAADKKGRIMDGKRGKKKKGKGPETSKGAAGFEEIEDENSKLISAILTGVNRSLPFAKIDTDDSGFMKHIDTLFLITHTSTFNISLQALVLLQQISSSMSSTSASSSSSSSASKSITDRYYRTLYSSLHDMRLASSSKQAMYLNLLFKSIKADAGNSDNNERMKALVRRFVQILVSGGNGATEFVAGGLYLLGEASDSILFSTIPGLRTVINEPAKTDDEPYDPRKRDPQYSRASSSPLWELTPLLHHYHPTISLHARQLLTSQPLTASADLSLNTLSHFLDRFVYKNPKKITADANGTKGKGASAMQPAGSALEGVKLVKGETAASGEMLMNEEQFLRKKAEDVPVDQLFFHKFFTRKREREQGKRSKGGEQAGDSDVDSEAEAEADRDSDEEEDDDSGGEEMDLTGDEAERAGEKDEEVEDEGDSDSDSDPEEAEIWKATSMPKADGDDDLLDDSDLDGDDDEIPSGLDEDSDDDLGSIEDDDDDDDQDLGDDDEDSLSFAEMSDNEDLVALDDIQGLMEYDGSDGSEGEQEEEWGGIGADTNKKRKRKAEEKGGKRKKLRSLPTFATYEEYAKMIEDGPEDDI